MQTLRSRPLPLSCKAGRTPKPGPQTEIEKLQTRSSNSHRLVERTVAVGLASSVLGPLCDNFHSQHGVLKYHHPLPISLSPFLTLETTWWTPIMFAVAGIILGLGVPFLDGILPQSRPQGGRNPSWAFVLTNISVFVTLYWASAVLESPLLGVTAFGTIPALDLTLCWAAFLAWTIFDATPQGLFMASLTAVCGPLIEIALIKGGDLYQYAHPSVVNAVPSWIAWVYFAGGPAVGNLGRKVADELMKQSISKDR